MVQIRFSQREINVKIVFYGIEMAGKTTTMELICRKLRPNSGNELKSLYIEEDRALFFDYPADHGNIGCMKLKFMMFTVPGYISFNETRKILLRHVDGIVFVADSRRQKMEQNRESIQNLEYNLKKFGLPIESVPIVMQWNKRDMPDIMDVESMERTLNPWKFPSYETIAIQGSGVLDCLTKIETMCIEAIVPKWEEKKVQRSEKKDTR